MPVAAARGRQSVWSCRATRGGHRRGVENAIFTFPAAYSYRGQCERLRTLGARVDRSASADDTGKNNLMARRQLAVVRRWTRLVRCQLPLRRRWRCCELPSRVGVACRGSRRMRCANAHHKALIQFRRLPLSASSEFPSFSIQSGTSKVSPSRAPSLRPYRYRHRHSRHTGTAGQGRWQWIGQRACGDMGTVRPFGLELLHGYVECAREWSRRQHPQEP
jgi:hypothetical protein